MEKINSLSLTEKEQLIRYLGYVYRKGITQNHTSSYAATPNETELIELLQALLKAMKHKYALILFNDFFELKERSWWHSMYSPSTYYRCKSAAVSLLLEQLYCAQ